MKHLLSLSLVVLSILSACITAEETEERLVIIGKQLGFERFESTCDQDQDHKETDERTLMIVCINMDEAFTARYSVQTVLEGQYHQDEISFEAYDHYGTPEFSRYDIAMIFLEKHNGQWYHQKYTWARVYPTVDGGYADCSELWIDNESAEFLQHLKPVTFAEPVVFDVNHVNDDLKIKYSNSSIYSVNNGVATCLKGYFAQDMLNDQRHYEAEVY